MSGLFLLLLAVVGIVWLVRSVNCFQLDAERLNLQVLKWVPFADGTHWLCFHREKHMAKIGDTFTARIAPTNAAGQPAPVSDVAYVASGGYAVTPAPDGLSAVLVANAGGSGFTLTAIATTAHGASLSETVALPDVEVAVDDEAVALNLTVA